MADISIINKDNTDYNVKDAAGRLALAEVENKGAKNLFPNYATSQNVGGVTFTVNSDGSITANGTKTNNDWLVLSTGNSIKAGTYVLSDGIPIDTTDCQLIITAERSLETAIMATAANARPKTTVLSTDYAGLYYAIRIASGKTVNNLNFKPMLCTAEDYAVSPAFVPYAPTNRELYEEKIDHDLPVVSGSILDYADTFAPGIYFARQSSSTGSGKPVNNRRYVYNIYVYSSATATIMAIEGEDPSNPRMFLTNKISGTWSSWYKFEGTVVT